ncbi:large multi-functional protein [Rhodopirellula maiorica SM1]|uniref:Large multi-functional protein n=2 Tax=Novipirellula TaxID=2795426 RepID=M5RHL7_9BACT|nr:large multi-functional protein [Rhodopirellula maiorica SM1]
MAAGPKGPVYTETPESEPNFPLMGEFVGPIQSDKEDKNVVALQIRAVGKDTFEAIQYLGGLPGEEGHKTETVQLIGRRSDDFVVLSGGPYAVFVEKDGCLVLDRKGNRLGELKRVERESSTLHAPPPEDAIVLFDGTSTDQFVDGQMTKDGLLMHGTKIKPMMQDFNLHLEFRLPYMPEALDQARGNSGIYLHGRYECQVLDSFATPAVFNGCGALYRFRTPDLNMCYPPLRWQTYDIQFTAARWDAEGNKIRGAHVTSWLNGVKIQDDVELPGPTGAGKPEEPNLLPTLFQDHGDPVRFRNVWIVDRGLASDTFPVRPSKEEIEAFEKQKQAKIEREKKEQEKKARELKEKKQKEEAEKKKQAEMKAAAEKAAAEKAATEKAATEKAATEKAATEKAATEKEAAEKAKAEKESAKPEAKEEAKPAEAKPAEAKSGDAKPADKAK